MKKTREEVQLEAEIEANKYKRRSLSISMRVGKTRIGLSIANNIFKRNKYSKILIVTPRLSIYKTWKDEIAKASMSHLSPSISFTTYRSLAKKNPGDYDLVILDEVHNILSSHLWFLKLYIGEILGLTGTEPTYSNSEKAKIINTYCPIVYRYKTDDAVESNILNDYRIMVHLIPLDSNNTIQVKTKNGGIFYNSEQKIYNYWTKKIEDADSFKVKQLTSIMRMKAMQTFPSKEEYTKLLVSKLEHKCLIFANTKDQADRLSTHSYHSGNMDSEMNLELFKKGEITNLSCVLQLSEGITINDLKSSIILHGYGNDNKFAQRFARCLSLNPEDIGIIHLLAYEQTVDAEKWVPQALESLDQTKIKYVKF